MSYGLKYFIQYPYMWINGDDQGQTTNADYYELQLHVKDFTGIPQEVPAGAGHPILRQDNSEQVVSQTLEFTVETSTGREFEDLYAEDPYSVEVILIHKDYSHQNENKLFRGWLITEQYNAPYIDPPFDITFSATDGIGLLKNKNFAMPLSAIRASEIDIIDHCLNNDLPQVAERYIVGLGIGHQGATAPASPLVSTYLNVSQFYDSDGLPMTRYDVLNAILRSYGPECYIKRNVDNYTIADTTFLMNTTINPVALVRNGEAWAVSQCATNFMASQKVDIASNTMGAAAPAIVIDQLGTEVQKRNGLFELTQEYNVASNMFAPGEINRSTFKIQTTGGVATIVPINWVPLSTNYKLWCNGFVNDNRPGNDYTVTPSIDFRLNRNSGAPTDWMVGKSVPVPVKASTDKLEIKLKFGKDRITVAVSIRCGTYWLTTTGWQQNPSNKKISIQLNETDSIVESTILADGFPETGDFEVSVGFPGSVSTEYLVRLYHVNVFTAPESYSPPASLIYNYSLAKYATGKLQATIIGDAPVDKPNIEIIHRDIKLTAAGFPVWDWQLTADGVASTNRRLAELWLLTAASNSRIPRKQLSGIVHLQHRHIVRDYVAGADNFNWLIIKPNAFPGNHPHFLFISGEIDLITNEVSGSYLQCLPYQELEMYATSAVPGGGASGSDGSQSGGSGTVAGSVNNHTHANKALLDTYTQTEANIAKAVALAGALSIKQDAQGRNYIEAIHDFVSRKGVAAYASSEAEVPSIWDALPIASPTKLGGIKVGTNLTIDANGVLHAQAGGVSSWVDLSDKPVWLNYATQAAFEGGHGHAWTQITGKPATFTPAAHTHLWADLTDKPATFAPSAHSHAQADITSASGWITTALAGKASTAVATTTVNGLMAYADKLKLDGIAANANNYIHPTNHPASIITQDSNNRFVTDVLIAAWNGKANAAHSHAQADIDSAAGWISTALAGKQAAGSYLTTTGQAYDSARLGGVVAANFYHSGNSNKSTVDWAAKNIIASESITSNGGDSQYIVQAPTNRAYSKIKFSKFTGPECSAIHSFEESWESGNLNMSGGALSLAGRNGVTLGSWDNPVLVIDQRNMTATVRGAIKSTSFELLNASGVTQYRFALSGTDMLIANAAGTTIGKIDQSGNLLMKGGIACYATI